MRGLRDLTALYKQVQQEQAAYWTDLENTLGSVYLAVIKELGLNEKFPGGLNYGFVNESGSFQRRSTDALPRTENSIQFALQIVVSTEDSINPPNLLVTRWSIRGVREGVCLTGEDEREVIFDSAASAAKAIFKASFDKLSKFSPYVE